MIAWIFPGQGSQASGMADGFTGATANDVFAKAEAILGWDVRAACRDLDDEHLRATEVAQPAIFTVSVAAAGTLEAAGIVPEAVAGHSVGEFAALVAAGAISFEDGLRAIVARADAMARAGEARPGGMAAVIGMPLDQIQAILASIGGEVVVANINGSDQVVISGPHSVLSEASRALVAGGARRVISLPVGVAAHSPLMAAAAADLAQALEAVRFKPLLVPFASGLSGRLHTDVAEVPRLLFGALTQPVRWTDCVHSLARAGVDRAVEVGPGRVVSGLVRRIDPAIQLSQVGNAAEAAALAAALVISLARGA
jgi:[acyl-carrier-protein] S-malonyltransferase